jgi:hypothetical protein
MYILLIPATVSLSLWLLGTCVSNEFLPTPLDVHLRHNFSSHVKQSVQALDSKYPHNVLLVLLCIHAVQVLFCLLMHVTKIMYGYFFGTLQGGDIRCVWELFLIGLFVLELLHLPLHRVPALLPAECAGSRSSCETSQSTTRSSNSTFSSASTWLHVCLSRTCLSSAQTSAHTMSTVTCSKCSCTARCLTGSPGNNQPGMHVSLTVTSARNTWSVRRAWSRTASRPTASHNCPLSTVR